MVLDSRMSSIAESLDRAERILASSGIAEPRREAISLVTASTRRDKTFVYAHPEYDLTTDELDTFEAILKRRSNREPLQYITGVQEFYGLDFEVTPDVLIPRPETELLVEQALKILTGNEAMSFCEVGVGSGCISVSILYHASDATAIGLDVSRPAIKVAERNARKHGVADRLNILESNVFEGLGNVRFGFIVSNPPYISAREMEGLQPEVRNYEPRSALTDERDGLSIIRRIASDSLEYLSDPGILLIEIGFDQADQVASMFDAAIWHTPEFTSDLQGIRRVVSARLK
jgi:release factor glutamine methyltransferase